MKDSRARGRRLFAGGIILALLVFFGLAEVYLRLSPPRDLHPYLGEDSPLVGPFREDPDFGVDYASWEAFVDDNDERLRPLMPLTNNPDHRPTWAMFGNSFIQAPGMLADTARTQLTDRRIFNLGKNEHLPIRFAQVRQLLNHGLKPEWIIVELMPADLLVLGPHPLSTWQVTSKGAITYRPGPESSLVGWLSSHSRVSLAAVVRSGRHQGNPHFNRNRLYESVEPQLQSDLRRLFGSLAAVGREHGVPITVVLIPAYHQIVGKACFQFQDTLAPMFRELGLDVCDPREPFLSYPDKEALFIPDRHFSDVGNRVLLSVLLDHIGQKGQGPIVKCGRTQ